jgi:hypothetical protein
MLLICNVLYHGYRYAIRPPEPRLRVQLLRFENGSERGWVWVVGSRGATYIRKPGKSGFITHSFPLLFVPSLLTHQTPNSPPMPSPVCSPSHS